MAERRHWPTAAAFALALVSGPVLARAAEPALPVIDMHLHAGRADFSVPLPICPGNQSLTYPALDPRDPLPKEPLMQCAHPILSPTTTAALKQGTIAELRRNNVRRAVLAGTPELVRDWMAAAPALFIPAAAPKEATTEAIGSLRALHEQHRADVFAELGAQYAGMRADDPKLEPFWALAEELDVPVGIHLGEGMPGQGEAQAQAQAQGSMPDRYRAGLTSPFQLEEVLIRHPRLRIYVMHAASPLTDEMIAMLYEYPSLYVDVAANDWNMPRAQFYDQLKRLVDAGFSTRIMFGSDQTAWPQAIGLAIRTIEQAPFLTATQKRDILYNNAARFLRLTKEQIARDHAR
jgi:predicted TIM-barrel fold metal-dependent hydrolase